MVWPYPLAVFYPYPGEIPLWQFLLSVLLILCVFVIVFCKRSKWPYALVGWLWYVGTLVPVIGLVQQGLWPRQADRFTYVPLIGLFLIISWGSYSFTESWHRQNSLLSLAGVMVLLILGNITWHQSQRWKNSITLFTHTLSVTSGNAVAHLNLGTALALEGREEEANLHLRKALEMQPLRPEPYIALGSLFLQQRRYEDALGLFSKALEIDINNKRALNNIGVVMLHLGKADEAIRYFRAALKFDRDYVMARRNLEIATGKIKRKANE